MGSSRAFRTHHFSDAPSASRYDLAMPAPSSVRLVCFDLGGVLLRICRSWTEGCRAAGLDLRSGPAFGDDPLSASPRNHLSRLYQTGRIDCSEYFGNLADAVDHLYTPAEIERIHHAWIIEEYPLVGRTIDHIHAAGLRTAALSNTNHAHWQRMREFPAVMKLHHRLASHELGMAKPDPAIYRAAEQRLGVNGAAILFFDDLIENIDAARSVGWQTVHIDHTRDTAGQIESALRSHGIPRS
jgi:putative hydrolase of the HAD superfamily